jgi:hypothetical protein
MDALCRMILVWRISAKQRNVYDWESLTDQKRKKELNREGGREGD